MKWTLGIVFLFSLTAIASTSSWTKGKMAVGTQETLQKNTPIPMSIPTDVAEKMEGETAVFYFSPTCPHCQAVMPEINQLAQDLPELSWLGVASSRATAEQLKAFRMSYSVPFPIIQDDENASFARSVQARATPNVYIFQKKEKEEGDAHFDSAENVELVDAYLPYSRGLAGILKLRKAPSSEPFAHFQGYQGSQVCINCHQEEGRSWIMTHHAQAYYTLYKQEKTSDAECVSCHVVGLGEDGGFVLEDHNSPMAGVGCESCHSASGPHDGETVDASQSCVNCHDAKHSIHFSVEKGMPHIDHYAVNALTEDEWRERINAIAEGTATKPLLAFSDGDYVGSESCAECHAGSHGKDPHAKALKTLSRKERGNSECLECHSFKEEKGVGCESCHGPGSEHVQSPSTENIVGLGESCPVCVVEAVCTNCHTKEWDPKWDLEQRLKKVKEWSK